MEVRLCTGLLRSRGRLLLVRSVYPQEPQPLWTLPGGRQRSGESIVEAVKREFFEETALVVLPTRLEYVSESLDDGGGLHVVNFTFSVRQEQRRSKPSAADPNIAEVRFVDFASAPALLRADVLSIPVAAALSGRSHPAYFFFSAGDIATPFFTATTGSRSERRGPARRPGRRQK
ncbi:MAG: NUDIX hydrolase [Candidatus Eremiobacteraeota bacterium]|nr:NUDIX hydrolase [Candidatus Eremiobacteraeota bacterium]